MRTILFQGYFAQSTNVANAIFQNKNYFKIMTSTIRKFLLFFLFLTSFLVVILTIVSNTYGTFTYAIWTRLEPEPKEVGGAIGVSITEVSYDVNVNDSEMVI